MKLELYGRKLWIRFKNEELQELQELQELRMGFYFGDFYWELKELDFALVNK